MTTIAGCVVGQPVEPHALATAWMDPAYMRLLLGSRLALFLRTRLEDDFNYTSTCGISTNKLLSKICGSKNKPRNQTTLLAPDESHVFQFMDGHTLRSIPGIGSRMASTIEALVTGNHAAADEHSSEPGMTVGDARSSPEVFPASLERTLGGPGAEKGVGSRIWALLHGIDAAEVKGTSDVPSQIGIEDTYRGLTTMPQITEELLKLSCSLVRRMRTDLLDEDNEGGGERWLARPRTLRLAIRSWHQTQGQMGSRSSRSGPLPSFVFDTTQDIEGIAERLVSESLVPLLRRLHADRGAKWNLQLINICAANMALGVGAGKSRGARDIGSMFKNQEETLKPWKVVDESAPEPSRAAQQEIQPEVLSERANEASGVDKGSGPAGGDGSCPRCGCLLPAFALPAHLRFHEMGE